MVDNYGYYKKVNIDNDRDYIKLTNLIIGSLDALDVPDIQRNQRIRDIDNIVRSLVQEAFEMGLRNKD